MAEEATSPPVCRLPLLVGRCNGCGGEMFDFERATCDYCGSLVHVGCTHRCKQCGEVRCAVCMVQDAESLEWFCETTTIFEKRHGVRTSTCLAEWRKEKQ